MSNEPVIYSSDFFLRHLEKHRQLEKNSIGPQGPKGDTGPQGPKGDIGPTGSGIGTTTVQNSITLGSTGSSPAPGMRTIQRIESQTIGDKLKIIYKLGQEPVKSNGSGDYLLTLPTNVAFNTSYHPLFTGILWTGGVHVMAQYFIPAHGGIVIDANWSNQLMVVPYDATRFRLAFTNNNSQSTYQFWNNGWYSVSSAINLNFSFEIWSMLPPPEVPKALGAMRPPPKV